MSAGNAKHESDRKMSMSKRQDALTDLFQECQRTKQWRFDNDKVKEVIQRHGFENPFDLTKIDSSKNLPPLLREQEGICAGCKTQFPFRVMDIDHILPLSRGGTGHIDNLQLLCSGCNRSKGNKTMPEWRAAQRPQ